MEMHHKLRRDPNWHPSACNICGQLGHQAAQCTNGTINWRQLYGDEAFRLKEPLYESELLRIRAAKDIDFSALEKRAKQYAEMQLNGGPPTAATPATAAQPTESLAASAAVKPEVPAGDGTAELPSGWSTAKDQQGRLYYWHTKTKKVMWDKPTEETPIEK